ncbi:hypothetical protein Hypma_005863, partial [Hypsizygus marmoreus]
MLEARRFPSRRDISGKKFQPLPLVSSPSSMSLQTGLSSFASYDRRELDSRHSRYDLLLDSGRRIMLRTLSSQYAITTEYNGILDYSTRSTPRTETQLLSDRKDVMLPYSPERPRDSGVCQSVTSVRLIVNSSHSTHDTCAHVNLQLPSIDCELRRKDLTLSGRSGDILDRLIIDVSTSTVHPPQLVVQELEPPAQAPPPADEDSPSERSSPPPSLPMKIGPPKKKKKKNPKLKANTQAPSISTGNAGNSGGAGTENDDRPQDVDGENTSAATLKMQAAARTRQSKKSQKAAADPASAITDFDNQPTTDSTRDTPTKPTAAGLNISEPHHRKQPDQPTAAGLNTSSTHTGNNPTKPPPVSTPAATPPETTRPTHHR